MPHDDQGEVNVPRYQQNTPTRDLRPHEMVMTLRWYSNELEQLSMGVLMNSPERLSAVSSVLHDALNRLGRLFECTDIGCNCPFPLCPNGTCAPECGGIGRLRYGPMPHLPDAPGGPGSPDTQ